MLVANSFAVAWPTLTNGNGWDRPHIDNWSLASILSLNNKDTVEYVWEKV